MKDSDLKKEKLKKGLMVAGIAGASVAAASGATVAAVHAFGDENDDMDETLPEVESDVEVEYPQDEASDQDEVLESTQPTYTVTSAPASASAPAAPAHQQPSTAPAVNPNDVELPVVDGEIGPEFDEIEVVLDYADADDAADDFAFASTYLTGEPVATIAEEAVTDTVYASFATSQIEEADMAQPDIIDMYDCQGLGVDMIEASHEMDGDADFAFDDAILN